MLLLEQIELLNNVKQVLHSKIAELEDKVSEAENSYSYEKQLLNDQINLLESQLSQQIRLKDEIKVKVNGFTSLVC